METIAQLRDDLYLRIIKLDDLNEPIATYLGITGLPWGRLYDANGDVVFEGLDWTTFDALFPAI